MKVAILADLHFGVRSSNPFIWNKQRSFFKNIFFPYCKKNHVKDVLILGDVFDQRKQLNINNLNEVIEDVLKPMRDMNVTILAGNHDTYFKDTNSVNSLSLLSYIMPDAKLVVAEAEEVMFDEMKMLICPWITMDNAEQVGNAIRSTKSKVVMGHFELNGFEMTRGNKCEHGLSQKLFSRFDIVRSGHFHLRSTIGNLGYVGSPYEMDWNDAGSLKGFDVLDTSTGDMTFVQNKDTGFIKIIYDEQKAQSVPLEVTDEVKNCFIKLIVNGTIEDRVSFTSLMTDLMKHGAADVKIVENPKVLDFSDSRVDEQVDVDTGSIITSALDEIKTDVDHAELKTLITEIYLEARSLA